MKISKIIFLLLITGFYLHPAIQSMITSHNSEKFIGMVLMGMVAMLLLFNLWRYGLSIGKNQTMGIFLLFSGLLVVLPAVFVYYGGIRSGKFAEYWVLSSVAVVISYLSMLALTIKNKKLFTSRLPVAAGGAVQKPRAGSHYPEKHPDVAINFSVMKVWKLLFLIIITMYYGGWAVSGIILMQGTITGIATYLLIPGVFLAGIWIYGLRMTAGWKMWQFLLYSTLFILLPVVIVYDAIRFMGSLRLFVISSVVVIVAYLGLFCVCLYRRALF